MSTVRRCNVILVNNYGTNIDVMEFKHQNGDDDWNEVPGKMAPGATWGPKTLTYRTGVGSPTDHWYIKFSDTDHGTTFDNDPDFDCSPESEDEGKTISIKIEGKLKVVMSDNDECEESWRPYQNR